MAGPRSVEPAHTPLRPVSEPARQGPLRVDPDAVAMLLDYFGYASPASVRAWLRTTRVVRQEIAVSLPGREEEEEL